MVVVVLVVVVLMLVENSEKNGVHDCEIMWLFLPWLINIIVEIMVSQCGVYGGDSRGDRCCNGGDEMVITMPLMVIFMLMLTL